MALFEELKVLIRMVNAGKRQNGQETNEKGDREQGEKPAVHRHLWPARHCSSLVINDPVHSPVTLEPTVCDDVLLSFGAAVDCGGDVS
jgi:hypothetical protein